jgi:hypothetical protein
MHEGDFVLPVQGEHLKHIVICSWQLVSVKGYFKW